MTLPHEFIFVFIWKFIGRHCWKGLAKRGGVQQKKKRGGGGGNIGELPKKGGSNLLHTMLLMFSTIVSLYLCMFYAHQKLKALLLLHVILHRMFSRNNSLLTYPLSSEQSLHGFSRNIICQFRFESLSHFWSKEMLLEIPFLHWLLTLFVLPLIW